MFAVSLVLLVAVVYSGNGESLPSYIKPCQLDDTFAKCVKEQMVTSLPYFTKGVPELGVPSLDPVNLDDIVIDGNGLKLSLKDAKLHGLGDADVQDLKLDIDAEKFSLVFTANMSVTGQYNIDGRILILPVQGNGDSTIKCDNIRVEIKSKLTHVKDSKGEHFKLITPNYSYQIGKTTFTFKNLFNGNKQLSDATHDFANQNWQQLMDDLAPPVIKQIVRTCVKAINKFFNKVTIDQIVLGYKPAN
uniref:Takeout Protein n=1 Tax=Epiphyas postvittana TaxID=65032 RepID=A0A0K8TUP1_EPIPO